MNRKLIEFAALIIAAAWQGYEWRGVWAAVIIVVGNFALLGAAMLAIDLWWVVKYKRAYRVHMTWCETWKHVRR